MSDSRDIENNELTKNNSIENLTNIKEVERHTSENSSQH